MYTVQQHCMYTVSMKNSMIFFYNLHTLTQSFHYEVITLSLKGLPRRVYGRSIFTIELAPLKTPFEETVREINEKWFYTKYFLLQEEIEETEKLISFKV